MNINDYHYLNNMDSAFLYQTPSFAVSALLFIAMLLSNWIGFRFKMRHMQNDPSKESEGLGVVEGSLFGLLSLVLGFTFSLSSARFDARRATIVQEANDIST